MKFSDNVERWRFRSGPYASNPLDTFGAFLIPGPCARTLMVIASSGDPDVQIDWEHVSVSAKRHPPNWREMCFIKELFWDDEETVMQLHPSKSKWINNHATCLHMWRPTKQQIPLPPDITVGIKELGTLT